jgi:5S rRNA maturation endonuclease (ribonuclease M5)
MDRKEKLEIISEINRLVDQINDESSGGSLILVEGKRDLEALSYLGCQGNIKIYHNFKSPIDIADNFRRNYKKLILLLDLDRTGEIMTKRICSVLNHRNIDVRYRARISKITKGKIKTIEELRSFYDNLLDERN